MAIPFSNPWPFLFSNRWSFLFSNPWPFLFSNPWPFLFSNRCSLWEDTIGFFQRQWRFGFFLCTEHTDYGSRDPRETLPRHSPDLSAEQGHRRQGPAPRRRRNRAGDFISRPSDAVRPHGAPCLPALWHEWYCIVPLCSVTLAPPPPLKQIGRYESNKPIKSKLTHPQLINQSINREVHNGSLRLIDWFNSPSEKLPHGDDFRVGPKNDRTQRDTQTFDDFSCDVFSSPFFWLAGGGDGASGHNLLIRDNGQMVNLGSKNAVPIYPGDCFRLLTPGGGGYGAV